MEGSDLNPSEPGDNEEQHVLYVSDGTYYTTAGDGQETMVTYMYGDEQSEGTQYMMIQGGEGEGDLQGGGEPYMVTSADGSVQYVLVSSEMASSAEPQLVLDQSGLEGQMGLMPTVLDDQMVGGEGLQSEEPVHLASEVTSEVDFLSMIEPVAADQGELPSEVGLAAEADFGPGLTGEGQNETREGQPEEADFLKGSGVIGVMKLEIQEDKNSTPELRTSGPEITESEAAVESESALVTETGITGTKSASSEDVISEVVSPVTISSVIIPSMAASSTDGDKTKKGTESVTKSIRVTSVPLPSSSESKDPKPIITVKPSAVKTLDGDRIKIETMGGVQKVFILPMSSPEKSAVKPVSSPMPVRFISQEQISSLPVQTITLPLTTTAMAVPRHPRPMSTVSMQPKTPTTILSPNIIKRPVGRPPLKDKAKAAQLQRSGPVKMRPSSSQVIVIPIQITKDSMAPTQVNGAGTKVTPSGVSAPKFKAVTATSKMLKEMKEREAAEKARVAQRMAKKQVEKSEEDTPSSTRRSKRSSNMSMKLAEWGLLPTGNRSTSSSDDDLEDELDFDDEEDENNEHFLDDDNESNSSFSLGMYAKSAQKGARKLASLEEKRVGTQITPKTALGKPPIRVTPGGSIPKKPVAVSQLPQAPREMQNKSLMCKPIMMTKATSCNPIRLAKVTQTEEDEGDVTKIVVPVPVPLFIPAPVAMFNKPAPIPLPLPVPVPVPALMPMTKASIGNILKQLKEVRDSLPSESIEADVLKVTEAEGSEEASAEDGINNKVLVKQELTGPSESRTSSGLQVPLEVVEMAMHIASQIPDDSNEVTDSHAGNTTDSTLTGESAEIHTSAMDVDSESADKRSVLGTDICEPPLKKSRAEPDAIKMSSSLRLVPINDAHMKLKYSYGISAWRQWVAQKNAQLEASAAGTTNRRIKPFKVEILQCNADELNFCLCLFIKEVRKPTGEEYAPDSIYYLCLGIQHYLYENGRIDSLFTDSCYSKFSDALNELMSGFEVRLSAHGQIVCRITEEHLWESRQLGAHSPYNLLNTLVYFNTKHFMLNTVDGHLGLSFSNIMKQWKKNAPSTDGRPARTVYLRYNAAGPVLTPANNVADATQRRKSIEMMPYEQLENPENPMRCPVKLYEFYLSKCPESIKHRNDIFYLLPEPSCVPDSPVWYSTLPLSAEVLAKMLNRIRLVREIQESQINQMPSYYT